MKIASLQITLSRIARPLALATACVLLPFSAFANTEQMVIKDTSGITRNMSEVEAAGDIKFELVDASGQPANGAEVTLTNAATGEVITGVSANGVVVFQGVAPGVWTVASTTPSVTFMSIGVTSGAAVAGAVGGTTVLGMSIPTAIGAGVAGSLAVAGASVAIVEAQDNSDDGETPLSPAS